MELLRRLFFGRRCLLAHLNSRIYSQARHSHSSSVRPDGLYKQEHVWLARKSGKADNQSVLVPGLGYWIAWIL